MIIQDNYSKYLSQRSAGDKVITRASAIAYRICFSEISDFAILEFDDELVRFTNFEVKDGRYRATKPKEDENKSLQQALPLRYLCDSHTQNWWNLIFLDRGDHHTYDSYYDQFSVSDLPVEENEESVQEGFNVLTFGQLMPQVRKVVETWIFLNGVKKLYVVGKFACPLLFYVIEQVYKGIQVNQIPCDVVLYDDEINETQKVILPEGLSQNMISICGGLPLVSLTANDPFKISLPINDMNLNDSVISNNSLSWKDLIKSTAITPDYLVVDTEFKELHIHIECDAYGNSFLMSDDLLNNHIVKQLLNI